MSKKLIVVSAIAITILSASSSYALLTMDKTPNENFENQKRADIATINNEKLLQQILLEAKKTNELLEKIANKADKKISQ